MYLSEKIGDDYLSWKGGQVIQITSPTGSGKTYFMLHKLMGRAIERGEKILYCVNRRILARQLEEELYGKISVEMSSRYGNLYRGINEHITIMTYQSIERAILENNVDLINKLRKMYAIVVYDECHYFYSDANFNTNTELSYDCLRTLFVGKIQIFMSATMKNMQPFIESRNIIFLGDEGEIWGDVTAQNRMMIDICSTNPKPYDIKNTYKNIKLTVFENIEKLIVVVAENVKKERKKWLLFVDSIELGRKLKDKIEDMDVENVVFIDANYSKDEIAHQAVDELAKKQLISKSVIISTSVMDNGISFHDLDLRNIVLLADTEESFIQMLGRKRNDSKQLNVYICKRDAQYFRKRLDYARRILKFYEYHRAIFNKMFMVQLGNTTEYDCKEVPANPYMFWERTRWIWPYFKQQKIIADIMGNDQYYRYAKKIYYSINGVFAVNHFAIGKYENLVKFYQNIVEELQNNENAFAELQAKWLGLEAEKIEEYIQSSEEEIFKKNSETLNSKIEMVCDKNLNRNDAIQFKISIKEEALYFLEKIKDQINSNVISDLKKKDRPITPETFELIIQQAQLPYKMTKPNKSTYLIQKE